MATRPGTGTRQEVIRRHNLGTLLRHLHRDGPLLRAQLTERMQLNRSTVGALVSELEAMGAVSQEVPTGARDGAGRPSLRVQPCADRFVALAAQLQVNDVTVARVGLGGAVLDRTSADLPPNRCPDEVAATVTTQVAELALRAGADATVVGLGVSVPGLVGRRDGLVRSAPNLGWTDTPFAALLTAELAEHVPQCPHPLLSNDADLGALAEQSRADSVVDDLVYLSGDVGVGGGLFVGGAPVVGVGGYAGELGHIRLREGRRPCRCGGQGCWETEIGAVAVAEAVGCPPSDLDALPRLLQGLDTPTPGLVETGRFLGEGLGLVTNMLNPRRIILGGLLADLYPVVREPCDEAMRQTALTASREQVELALPALGRDSVLLGAAELAFAAFFADPASWASDKAAARQRAGNGAQTGGG